MDWILPMTFSLFITQLINLSTTGFIILYTTPVFAVLIPFLGVIYFIAYVRYPFVHAPVFFFSCFFITVLLVFYLSFLCCLYVTR